MNTKMRSLNMILPTGEVASITLELTSFLKLSFINTNLLNSRLITARSNIAVWQPSIVVVDDVAMPGRLQLMSRSTFPNNDIEYCLYYDSKYGDIIQLPSVEYYAGMPYINGISIVMSGYGINFSGLPGDKLPAPNPIYGIPTALINCGNYVNNQNKGTRYRRSVTPTLTYVSPSIYPAVMIVFGAPLVMFPLLNFIADINIVSYDNVFSRTLTNAGKQFIKNTGTLIVEMPM